MMYNFCMKNDKLKTGISSYNSKDLKRDLDRYLKNKELYMTRDEIKKNFKENYVLGKLNIENLKSNFNDKLISISNFDIARILEKHCLEMTRDELHLIFDTIKNPNVILEMDDRKESSVMIYKNIPDKDNRFMEMIIIERENGECIIHYMKTSKRRKNKKELEYNVLYKFD